MILGFICDYPRYYSPQRYEGTKDERQPLLTANEDVTLQQGEPKKVTIILVTIVVVQNELFLHSRCGNSSDKSCVALTTLKPCSGKINILFQKLVEKFNSLV